jgi:Zn-dependent protease with chaperone function
MRTLHRLLFTALLLTAALPSAMAQCSMCRAVSGSGNLAEEGFTPGRGLNDAILYLMAMPYIFALIFVLVFFRSQIAEKLWGKPSASDVHSESGI